MRVPVESSTGRRVDVAAIIAGAVNLTTGVRRRRSAAAQPGDVASSTMPTPGRRVGTARRGPVLVAGAVLVVTRETARRLDPSEVNDLTAVPAIAAAWWAEVTS